ncbi:MAG: tetratricopeptide repeat protein [Puniceicoccales bacterium]|jgi:outer membrane protein assembly factor BamD|nr:tetratricopeptide repeat protein [Puniceicoccales bacterium]
MLNKRFVFLSLMLCILVTSCTTPKEVDSGSSRRARRARNRKVYDDIAIVERFREAENCYSCGDKKGALKICDDIVKKHQNSSIIAEALFLMGEIYLNKHQYDNACNSFNNIILKHNNSPLFKAAVEKQYEVAKSLHSGERPYYFGIIPGFKSRNSSVKYYEKVIKNAPFTCKAQESLFNIYKIHRRAKKYDLAFAALDRLIDEYPTSALLPDAYLAMAGMYQSLGKGPDYDQKAVCLALNYYSDFIVIFPTHGMVDFAKEQVDKLLAGLVKVDINIGDFYYNAKHNPEAAYSMYKVASEINCKDELKVEARAKMDDLINGVPPLKTSVDFLFRKYKEHNISEWAKNGCVDIPEVAMPQIDAASSSLAESGVDQSAKGDDSIKPAQDGEKSVVDQKNKTEKILEVGGKNVI